MSAGNYSVLPLHLNFWPTIYCILPIQISPKIHLHLRAWPYLPACSYNTSLLIFHQENNTVVSFGRVEPLKIFSVCISYKMLLVDSTAFFFCFVLFQLLHCFLSEYWKIMSHSCHLPSGKKITKRIFIVSPDLISEKHLSHNLLKNEILPIPFTDS